MLRGRRILTLVPGLDGDAIWWEKGRVRGVGRAAVIDRQAPRDLPRFDLPNALITPGFVDGHTHFAMWALGRRRVQLAGARTRAEAVTPGRGSRAVAGMGPGPRVGRQRLERAPGPVRARPVQRGPGVPRFARRSRGLGEQRGARRPPESPGRRPIRPAVGSCGTPRASRPGCCWSAPWSCVARVVPPPPDGSAGRGPARGAGRGAPAGGHRNPRRGGRAAPGGIPPSRAGGRAPAPGAVPSARRFAAGSRPPRRAERRRLPLARHGRGQAVPRRQPRQPDRVDARAVRGKPRPGHADHRRGGGRRGDGTAAEAGIAATVHAIGDAAVRRALDLLERLPRAAMPHRIEHFQCVHPPTSTARPRAGIVVSMQPAHLLTDIPLVDRHWGARGRGAYAFRSLLAARHAGGLRERRAGGLDRPAGGRLRGARAAGDRRCAARRLAARGEARASRRRSRAYTAGGRAVAGGVGDRAGALGPGHGCRPRGMGRGPRGRAGRRGRLPRGPGACSRWSAARS